ncbi:MAG TPA: hypothetical protein V6C90_08980 [Coleofasciculaceae cyanobacterium]
MKGAYLWCQKITKTTTTSAFQPTGANPKFHIARRVRARSVFPGTTRILSRRDFWSCVRNQAIAFG